jgi:sulfhydrogenase subunit gamma (sulfur reductase)
MTRKNGSSPMLPHLGRLAEIQDLGTEIKLLRVELLNGAQREFEGYQPGQFAFLSAFGSGEAPFGLASISSNDAMLDFAVQRMGCVTTALHELGDGDLVGVRGPFGNSFPMPEFKGKNLIVMGGGIGGAPLRPVIQSVLKARKDYGSLTILWAARNPSLLIFRDEYESWRAAPDTELHLTVDQADENWHGSEGLITELLERLAPSPHNAVTITCGPPIMIHFVHQSLKKLGFAPADGYVTLESRMHCGIGKCGRCNLGEQLICVDGPVFSMAEVDGMMESYL